MKTSATLMKGSIDAATMPLCGRHYWIVAVSSLGQLIGTALATVAGVIIPMLNILAHPELPSAMQGLIGAIDLVGICIGSVIFGRFSDRFGYLLFFRLCPALILGASLVSIFAPDVWVLIACLLVCGLGIGGEYSLDSDYVTDLVPMRYRSLMVGVTKTASALGNIIAAAVCFGLVLYWRDASRWPDLMWIVAATAAVMLVTRIKYYESPGWLISKGKFAEAEKTVKEFLGDDVYINLPETVSPSPMPVQAPKRPGLLRFMLSNWRQVVLSGVPWACEGLGVYGIGVFLPILVMALGLEHFSPSDPEIYHVALSVKVTLWISCIMLPGFIAGLILINRKDKITAIQTWGFSLCAISLAILLLAYQYHWNKWASIGAFMAFEFFLNMGPHLITYVLPPKIYPQATRGLGVGLAASIGKIGAVLGVFCIPVLLKSGGADLVLIVSAAVMALGALVTATVKVKPVTDNN